MQATLTESVEFLRRRLVLDHICPKMAIDITLSGSSTTREELTAELEAKYPGVLARHEESYRLARENEEPLAAVFGMLEAPKIITSKCALFTAPEFRNLN